LAKGPCVEVKKAMPIPDYQSMMHPALRRLADGGEHGLRELLEQVADDLGLSPDERAEALDSGNGTKLYSRLQWAYTYMAQAKLLEKVRRGVYCISSRGLELLKEDRTRIDNSVLRRYPEFQAFMVRTPTAERADSGAPVVAEADPDSMVDSSSRAIREQVVGELSDRVGNLSPAEFELLAVQLLEAIGYGRGRVTGRSGDRGVDGVLEGDALGLDRVYVQCKKFTAGSVGGEDLRNFIGALHQHRATRGVFVTTTGFSPEAVAAAQSSTYSIVLLDGRRVAELMYDYDVGVIVDRTIVLKRIDEGRFLPL
jgi:restriction system protein